jgi:hypothetical protein
MGYYFVVGFSTYILEYMVSKHGFDHSSQQTAFSLTFAHTGVTLEE